MNKQGCKVNTYIQMGENIYNNRAVRYFSLRGLRFPESLLIAGFFQLQAFEARIFCKTK